MAENLRIVITAGGTSEPIDEVRCISNRSSGRLARAIAGRLFEIGGRSVERLYYIHGPGASLPETPRTILAPVETVKDLSEFLSSLLRGGGVSAIVHAMAVSDYRVAGVASIESISAAIAHALSCGALRPSVKENALAGAIGRIIAKTHSIASGKIPSDIEDPVLLLDRTPKVISGLRTAAPKAVIVGFKLLCGVEEGELVGAGLRLLGATRCSYVFANDARAAFGSGHAGFLVAPDGSYERLEGIDEIAQRVAETVLRDAGGGDL